MKHTLHTSNSNNGSTVTIVHAPTAARVEVRLYFKGGFLYFKRDKYHLPHMLEHLMLGSSLKSGNEAHISQRLQRLGAMANASTDFDLITVQLTAPLATYKEALNLVLKSVYSNTFDTEDVELEKQVILREIYEKYDGPGSAVAAETINKLIYQDKLTEQQEEVASVEALKIADIKSAYRKFIRPENMTVLIAGNIPETSRIELIATFENLTIGPAPAGKISRRYRFKTPAKSLLIDRPYGDGINGSFLYTSVIPNDNTVSDRTLALQSIVFNMFFGGPAAVIPTELRQRGLVYSADFDATGIQDKKVLSCSLYTDDDRLPEAVAEFYRILKTYSVLPLPQGSYESIKLFGLSVLPTLQETASDLIGWYEFPLLAGRSLTGIEHDMEILRTVTEQEIANTVRDCFISPTNHWSVIAKETDSWLHEFMTDALEAIKPNKSSIQATDELTKVISIVTENRQSVSSNQNGVFWLIFLLLCTAVQISLLMISSFPNPNHSGTISMLDYALNTHRYWLIAGTIGALFATQVSGNYINRKHGRSTMVLFSVIAAICYWWAVFRYFKDIGVEEQPWFEDVAGLIQLIFFSVLVPRATYLIIRHRLTKQTT